MISLITYTMSFSCWILVPERPGKVSTSSDLGPAHEQRKRPASWSRQASNLHAPGRA